MGLFRLILAALVAVGHLGHNFFGYHPGVVAVISFYLLSGFVMSELIEKYYKTPSSITMFYLDRSARLFPQFLFYSAIAALCIYVLKIDSQFTDKLTIGKWILNLLIIPQNFYMVGQWGIGAMPIPQAWSLGLEVTFYLVIPFIVLYLSTRQIFILSFLSFLIFLAAYFGLINTDYFGYRLLPGTLYIFLIGWSFYKNDLECNYFRYAMIFLAVTLWIFAHINEDLQRPFNKEVLLGLLVGIFAISCLKNIRYSRLDEFLGNLSYGVFLNHIIVIWLIQKYYSFNDIGLYSTFIFLSSSLVFAFISYYLVEYPALKWRRSLRAKAMKSQNSS
jgi:peptidoglycan/LPS O-acetylase OafA/YrhL